MVSFEQLSPAGLAAAADDNLAVHAGWVHQRVASMQVVDVPGLMLVDCGLACDTFNIVCRARLEPAVAQTRVRQAIDYFAHVGRPFAWWHGPADQPSDLAALLEGAGLHCAETELAMAADPATLRGGELSPGGLQVRRVRTTAELIDFAHIVAENWTPPDANVLRFYEQAAPFVLADTPALWMYVGYLDSVPVAASELTEGGGVAGLYNVCTLRNYRRRGFAAALTLRPLLDAREKGYRIATLQASAGGASVYARVGFEPFARYREYKPA